MGKSVPFKWNTVLRTPFSSCDTAPFSISFSSFSQKIEYKYAYFSDILLSADAQQQQKHIV